MEGRCKSCKKWEEHYYWNHLDVKKMHFYKVMTEDFSQNMRIPKKFINHFKGELSEIVDLKGPSGNTWHVELTKTADGIFLQSGWKDFVKAHHIGENDLLVFKYDGNSCFDILMFDGTGCEKAASYFVKSIESRKQERSEDFMEVLNVTPRRRVIVHSSSSSSRDGILQAVPSSIPHKICRGNRKVANKNQRVGLSCRKRIARSNELSVHPMNKQGEPRKSVGTLKVTKYHIKHESVDMHICEKLTHPNLFMSRKTQLTDEGKKKALQLARAVRSDNPCFISIMQPTSVGKRSFLTVPSGFAAEHLPSQGCSIFLQVPGQRKKWCVKFLVQKIVSGFSGQWRYFVLDNNLAEGDLCLFELMGNYRDIMMTVNISRAANQVRSLKESCIPTANK